MPNCPQRLQTLPEEFTRTSTADIEALRRQNVGRSGKRLAHVDAFFQGRQDVLDAAKEKAKRWNFSVNT